jgi:hypothetical protein
MVFFGHGYKVAEMANPKIEADALSRLLSSASKQGK